MEPETRRLTTRHAAVAAVLSFVLQPIPGADELIVVPIHYRFVRKVAKARKVGVRDMPWGPAQKIIWWGAGARLLANFSLGLIPVAGAFSNAVTAVALTEFLARYLDDVLDHPDRPPPPVTLKDLKQMLERALKKQPEAAASPAAPAGAAVNGAGAAPAAS